MNTEIMLGESVLVSANELVGKKVVGVNGDAIGEVKDVEFDNSTWKIIDLLIKLSDKAASELGFTKVSGGLGPVTLTRGNKNVFMPVNLIASVGDIITVNKTLLEITHDQLLKRYAG
jgi:sporulation protein YlmC with PRC-barrel domain